MGEKGNLNKIPICIICEGAEEYDYLFRIRQLNVWDEIYKVELVNAEGNGNLPARYQDRFQNDAYELVLVFCDTDKKPYEQYQDIKNKIDYFHGIDGISDEILIFGNPCTMQIILQHWKEVSLTTSSKKKNAPLIEECTGIKGYDARSEERAKMMSAISVDNYNIMLERVSRMSKDDHDVGSSNFDILMNNLSDEDSGWIERINGLME